MKLSMKGALLLVPILLLGGMSLLHEYNRSTGAAWTVPIVGYDPRDLLSGHYLQFQYEWNLPPGPRAPQCYNGDDCALCTQDAGRFNPQVSLVPADEAPAACASFIAVSMQEDMFYISGARDNLQRYYIPESEAERLQMMLLPNATTTNATEPPQFSLGLRVTSDGIAYIETMYVDGVQLEQWLQAN